MYNFLLILMMNVLIHLISFVCFSLLIQKDLLLVIMAITSFFLQLIFYLGIRDDDERDHPGNIMHALPDMVLRSIHDKNAKGDALPHSSEIEGELRASIKKKDDDISQMQHRLDFMTSQPERRILEDRLEKARQKRLLLVDRLNTLPEKQSLIDRVDSVLSEGGNPTTRAERELRDKLIHENIIRS